MVVTSLLGQGKTFRHWWQDRQADLDPFGIEDGNGPTLDANSLTLWGWVDGGHLSNQLHRH